MTALRLLDDPDELAGALTPLRRRVLAALTEPASATELAPALGLTRQKVNYHLRVLEQFGLVELVELRQRRGCMERVLQRTGDLVVDPALLQSPPRTEHGAPGARVAARDRHTAEHLISVASRTVRDVTRMQSAAAQQHRRLLTFTVEADVAFAEPADVHRFTDELAAALAELATSYHSPTGRRYAVTVGGHPATGAAPATGSALSPGGTT